MGWLLQYFLRLEGPQVLVTERPGIRRGSGLVGMWVGVMKAWQYSHWENCVKQPNTGKNIPNSVTICDYFLAQRRLSPVQCMFTDLNYSQPGQTGCHVRHLQWPLAAFTQDIPLIAGSPRPGGNFTQPQCPL